MSPPAQGDRNQTATSCKGSERYLTCLTSGRTAIMPTPRRGRARHWQPSAAAGQFRVPSHFLQSPSRDPAPHPPSPRSRHCQVRAQGPAHISGPSLLSQFQYPFSSGHHAAPLACWPRLARAGVAAHTTAKPYGVAHCASTQITSTRGSTSKEACAGI